MEHHIYHIRLPPLNATFFIMHVRNCVMGATPMKWVSKEAWMSLNVYSLCLENYSL